MLRLAPFLILFGCTAISDFDGFSARDGAPSEDGGTADSAPGDANPQDGGPDACGTGALCGEECVDTQTSSDHCGGCNNICELGCIGGACREEMFVSLSRTDGVFIPRAAVATPDFYFFGGHINQRDTPSVAPGPNTIPHVAAYDTDGGLAWARSFGGEGNYIHDIAYADGNVYVVGRMRSPLLDTEGPPIFGLQDGELGTFFLVFGEDGSLNETASHLFRAIPNGPIEPSMNHALIAASEGVVMVTFAYRGQLQNGVGGPTGDTRNRHSMVTAFFQPDTDPRIYEHSTGTNSARATALTANADGVFFLSGWGEDKIDFRTGEVDIDADRPFFARFSEGGTMQESISIRSHDLSRVRDIAVDGDTLYIAGQNAEDRTIGILRRSGSETDDWQEYAGTDGTSPPATVLDVRSVSVHNNVVRVTFSLTGDRLSSSSGCIDHNVQGWDGLVLQASGEHGEPLLVDMGTAQNDYLLDGVTTNGGGHLVTGVRPGDEPDSPLEGFFAVRTVDDTFCGDM